MAAEIVEDHLKENNSNNLHSGALGTASSPPTPVT